MSASILFEPVNPKKSKQIGVGAPSAFIAAMHRAGFDLPCTVEFADAAKIAGMAACFGAPQPDRPNPYEEILDARTDHGAIRLWAEY